MTAEIVTESNVAVFNMSSRESYRSLYGGKVSMASVVDLSASNLAIMYLVLLCLSTITGSHAVTDDVVFPGCECTCDTDANYTCGTPEYDCLDPSGDTCEGVGAQESMET